ncbi:MAG TPA: hypothetical protein VNJ70_07680 [Thermoanaerobaculia bacterium]|nr:hypothetical protein [Thermoanaerobaculia bacterium]
MEPITTALIAAAVAGVAKMGEQAIADAYSGLKSLIRRKFGSDSEVAKAVEAVEAKPESEGRKATLAEELKAAKAEEDQELVEAARRLLEQIQAQPRGTQIVQQATGVNIAQAADHSTATVNVNQSKT